MTVLLDLIVKFLSKPSNIVILILLVVIAGMTTNTLAKNIKISSLESKLEKSNIALDKCKSEREQDAISFQQERDIYTSNITTLKQTIYDFEDTAKEWQDLITDKNVQIKKEQERVEYWKKQYVNKVCVNNDDEVVKPTQGIINESSNVKVLTQLNTFFGHGVQL